MATLPTIYLPHGGGPWPFVDLKPFVDPKESSSLSAYLRDLPRQLPEVPKALLVISAHWETRVPTVMTSPNPPMYYDYYGFPPASYQIQWPAPGSPTLAARVASLLQAAGFPCEQDPSRGFDHGTFIPLKVAFPNADIPTIQLSLQAGLDPKIHLALGKALAPLRQEGVLILGSGMSFHNMRAFGAPNVENLSAVFDNWLKETIPLDEKSRNERLARWAEAPGARFSHPREEHLLPLMVVAGAAGSDVGRVTWSDRFARSQISSAHFGS